MNQWTGGGHRPHLFGLALPLVYIIALTSFSSSVHTDNSTRVLQLDAARRKLPSYSFRSGMIRQITPTRNISSLLDNLLRGYDQKLRPSFGGEPTTVEIDIEVRSMSQISEMDMTYSMDCYFRQSWVDERLAFSDLDEAFTLSVAVLEKLWKPDTFIYNGKKSHVHLLTTPNKFIRLYQNGKILYSSRLTINANCPMNLHHFPMDTQHCPLKLGSFAYTTSDVVYRWNTARQVVIAKDMKLSQFDLIAAPSGFENTTRRTGEFSTLLASFYLQRHMGNFLIQVYGPCMLLVVLSWVSFWLNREATSDRISLGITTVLTMTFLGLEARTDLPKVSYSTALDMFVWLSYGFIFATIIEFAFVHIFTKVGSGEVYLSETSSELDFDEDEEKDDDDDEGDEEEMEDEEDPDTEPVACTIMTVAPRQDGAPNKGPNGVRSSRPRPHLLMRTPTTTISSQRNSSVATRRTTFCVKFSTFWRRKKRDVATSPLQTFDGTKTFQDVQQPQPETRRCNKRTSSMLQMNSVSHIDEVSRVLFPLSFLCINLLYWYTFLSTSSWPEQL